MIIGYLINHLLSTLLTRKIAVMFDYKKAPGAEAAFWSQVANAANPGWSMSVRQDHVLDTPKVSDVDVFVYVVDTSSLWVAGAGTRESDAQAALNNLPAMAYGVRCAIAESLGVERPEMASSGDIDSDAIMSSAGSSVLAASDAGASDEDPEVMNALTLAWLAVSLTKTFQQAKLATGGIKGHWLYAVYRAKNGNAISRPAFIGANKDCRFMPPNVLVDLVRQVVEFDMGNKGGAVLASLSKDGGAVLADELRGAALP